MTGPRPRRRALIAVALASVTMLGAAGMLWWVSTEGDRRLDRQVTEALDRYELAYRHNGVRATPTPPPWNPYDPPSGAPSVEKASVHRDDTTLTVDFIGGPVGEGPCGMTYGARAVESEHSVLVVVEGHANQAGAACTSEGYPRRATVRLARPLDGRAVLEAMQGMPVPVTPTE
ncbi:hypothetical protein [Planomonospora parontospora]|uniref:hypothetical protein n=1 Tax=Planomonospora parontospora TaxID=58119 RepID=UPI00166F798B|nr:hypothetical protein [Planomonospora parontospora]